MDKLTLLLAAALFCLTAAAFLWLCFMLWKPGKWGAFVDWEYDFWVRWHLVSPSLAQKCKRLEKGPVLKWLVGATVLVGTVFLALIGFAVLRS